MLPVYPVGKNAKMLPERGTILSSGAYKSGRKLILLSNRILTFVLTLELIKVKENSRTTHSVQALGTVGSVLSSRAFSTEGSALSSRR